MRRRRRSSFRKEKAIMLVSSCLVLTALTATGLYVRNKSQDKEDGYVVDFTALEESNKQKQAKRRRTEAQETASMQIPANWTTIPASRKRIPEMWTTPE